MWKEAGLTVAFQKHKRRSIRLKGFDYTQAGAYFLTICTFQRECIFGNIIDGESKLNEFGRIVMEEWERSATIRSEIEIDEFIIMPNHMHGIVIINGVTNGISNAGANGRSPLPRESENAIAAATSSNSHSPLQMKPKSISSFVSGFKSAVTKRINIARNTSSVSVWQRNYHEHIIRAENELHQIREYVLKNPAQWELDIENPQNSEEIENKA